jgi:ATP-dependent RNA helicase DDX21
MEMVNETVLVHFEVAAQELIESKGPLKAVQLALAYISGNTQKIKKRSLLTAEEGYVTFECVCDEEFRGISFVWGILRKLVPETINNQIKSMRQFQDMKGAAFDVPED